MTSFHWLIPSVRVQLIERVLRGKRNPDRSTTRQRNPWLISDGTFRWLKYQWPASLAVTMGFTRSRSLCNCTSTAATATKREEYFSSCFFLVFRWKTMPTASIKHLWRCSSVYFASNEMSRGKKPSCFNHNFRGHCRPLYPSYSRTDFWDFFCS